VAACTVAQIQGLAYIWAVFLPPITRVLLVGRLLVTKIKFITLNKVRSIYVYVSWGSLDSGQWNGPGALPDTCNASASSGATAAAALTCQTKRSAHRLANLIREEVRMKAIRFALGWILFLTLFASASVAQQRTFVSGLGNDLNPCSRTAPCRTFSQAISQTGAGGEVYILDTAGYGPFAITKAVSIVAQGVTAGISVFSGDGIDINVGSGETVILRGLTLSNHGSMGNGIAFLSGGTLHVESCVVSGFSAGNGILCNGGGKLEVKDSIMRGNGNGISITGTSSVAVDQVRLEGNSSIGLIAQDGAKVTVRNSIASDNAAGFDANSTGAAAVELNIESCVASNNGSTGVQVQSLSTGVAIARVSNSTVTDNGIGFRTFGPPALLLSRGNNTVEGNPNGDTPGAGTYAAK
jgi:hypothetical protein